MSRISLAFLLVSIASGFDDSTWGPSDSVHALDAVITAVNQIVKNPHLSPDNLKKATKVAEDIKGDIEAVEGGKLTKSQAHDKVGAAIKELSSFEVDLSKPSATVDKISLLKKELADKEALLAKTENMMKLLKLKKQLAEKKLMLETLLDKQASAKNGQKADQEELAKTSSMVSSLVKMAKDLAGKGQGKDEAAEKNGKQELPGPLKAVLTTLQSREKVLSEGLSKSVAEHQKGDAELDSAMQKEKSGSQRQTMVKRLRADVDHKFAKARALKQNELNELKEAESSLESRDINKLQKVLAKMQHETRALEAKSGNFLH